MMLPRAVALAKATALPLPASPVQDIPREAPARSSGNIMVRECLHTQLQMKSDGVLASTQPDRLKSLHCLKVVTVYYNGNRLLGTLRTSVLMLQEVNTGN